MTYPLKFRQQVPAIRQKENLTFKQTAERSGAGIATVMRRAKNPQPVTKRNKPATKINRQLSAQDVAERPDAFLYERAERSGVTATGIARALKRLRISYKKTFRHPEADDSAGEAFQARTEEHRKPGNPVVYSDESGFLRICHGAMAGHAEGNAVLAHQCYRGLTG